jgi:hypothetical protein
LSYSHFNFVAPSLTLRSFFFLAVVCNLENEELLVQKEELAEPLEVDEKV